MKTDKKPIFGGISKEVKPSLSEILKRKEKDKKQGTEAKDTTIKGVIDTDDSVGIVLYTDAGARPNPGFAGWGIHGYLFKEKTGKASAGHPTHHPTNQGYKLKRDVRASKSDELREVSVQAYFDSSGSFANDISNNVGEIQAAVHALRLAEEYIVKKVILFSDSKYVVEGITKWINKWIKFNWRRPDGSEYANREHWEQLLKAKDDLEARGIEVDIQHLYGHVGDVGNERADTYATIGIMRARDSHTGAQLSISPPEGYWRYDSNRHPMLSSKAIYYLNSKEHIEKGLYYTGAHGKDDEVLGTRMTDGSYSIVRLEEPETCIELLREATIKIAKQRNQKEDVFILGNLNSLYRPETHRIINEFGEYAFVNNNNNLTSVVSPVTKEVLATELVPSRNSFRALGALEEIDEVLQTYLSFKDELGKHKDDESLNNWLVKNKEAVAITDLTEILYETVSVKRGKKEYPERRLKAEYTVGFAVLDVSVWHRALKDDLTKSEIKLILGIDLPNRNALKRLEKLGPRVSLITWVEPDSELVFRYATIIEAKGCQGIWSGHYSNYRFLGEYFKEKKKEKKSKT